MGKLTNARLGIAPVRTSLRPPPKIAEQFYMSPEWRGLVKRIKATRGNWCQRCGSTHRVIADHIKERRDGGADLDETNIELLCHACHQRKTAQAQARRARGEA